jgi:hypothetical protein
MKLLPDDLYERLLMQARVSGFKETQAMLQQLQDAPSYVQPHSLTESEAGRIARKSGAPRYMHDTIEGRLALALFFDEASRFISNSPTKGA